MIRILLIDDEDDERFRDDFRDTAKTEVGTDVEVVYLDPNQFLRKSTDAEIDLLLAEVSRLAAPRLDLVLCDINLSDKLVGLPITIVGHIRSSNKVCIILLYSGSVYKYLDDLIKTKHTKKGKEVEHPIRELFKCEVAEFLARDDVADGAVRYLLKPPLSLHMEQRLCRQPNTKVDVGVGRMGGCTLGEIAACVRSRSDKGVEFCHEVVDRAVDVMLDLNS